MTQHTRNGRAARIRRQQSAAARAEARAAMTDEERAAKDRETWRQVMGLEERPDWL